MRNRDHRPFAETPGNATYLYEINLVERVIAPRLLDIENGNDVLVVEVTQELHLSQGSEAEHGVVEWSDLLDCHFLARGLVNGRAAVGESVISNCPSMRRATGGDSPAYQTTP